ncbi:MAG TPA: hypothetical protein VMM92_09955, partial [Thermoanaerobaculia bacterium]|nr:hypothetical protein [Thermoanaerobaculia bacterium]
MPICRGLATLGPYQVLAELGAVPWGTAYVAVDGRSDTEVELLLVPESRWGADEGEVSWEGLLAETAALARIYHPGLPALLEITLLEGELLIATAAVAGPSLWEELRSGRWPDRAR